MLCSSVIESVVLVCEVVLGWWCIVYYDMWDRVVINCVSVMVCCIMCYCDGVSLMVFMLCLIIIRCSSFFYSVIEF